MITVQTINEKLGFDFRTWQPEDDLNIEDDREYYNPFTILTEAEKDFIFEYKLNMSRNT